MYRRMRALISAKFVINNPEPFIVQTESGEIIPYITQYHGQRKKNGAAEARGQQLKEPLLTVDASNRYGLVTSFISKFYKSGIGQDMREPLHTVTTSPGHFGEVRAFLIKYYGHGTGQDIKEPLDTVTACDRFGLVELRGEQYKITDIGLRMLDPSELYKAQGFPEDYIIDHDYKGNIYTRSEQVEKCGNAVPPPFAAALVKANLPELCIGDRNKNLNPYKLKEETDGQMKFA